MLCLQRTCKCGGPVQFNLGGGVQNGDGSLLPWIFLLDIAVTNV